MSAERSGATGVSPRLMPCEQLANRRVGLGEAAEDAMAQAAEEPAPDDEDGLFDLVRAVSAAAPARRQCHNATPSPHRCDLFAAVEARLDDRDLDVV